MVTLPEIGLKPYLQTNITFVFTRQTAQWIFRLLLKILSPFLSAATLSTIKVFGSNKEEWKEELLKHLPADQFPVEYGGTQGKGTNTTQYE
jgi:hypothetical protein